MKSKSVVLMVVSLGFGLIAAIGISQVMGNNSNTEPTVERGQVLVAAVNLNHGDELTEENVKIEHWPKEVIPAEAVRDFEQIKNKKMITRLSKSLPIMLADTANPNEIGKIEVPAGFKLVAIKVSAEDTISGLIKPGDRVDLIGVVNVRSRDPNVRGNGQTVSQTFLKNIEVYSVDGKLSSEGPREGNQSKNAIVSVLVNEKQSEMVVLVQQVAKLRLVLRGKEETVGDEVEFTNYNGFYESVFGKSGEEVKTDAPAKTYASLEMHTTRVWEGPKFEEVQFEGQRRITDADKANMESELNDSADYERSGENASNLEEDQYPGE